MEGKQEPDAFQPAGVTVAEVARALAAVRPAGDSAGLIRQLREFEDLKSAAAASQARFAVTLDLLQRREQADAGMSAAELGAGVAAQIALARRESPAKGGRLLGLAKALVTEMPHTLAALESGQLSEWRATNLVRETACLTAEDRAAVDEELAPDTGTFDGAGDRTIIAAARAAAYRRAPRTVTQRASHAATERNVSLRPAPDTMCYLTALLPVAQGVAVHAALTRHADSLRSAGDPRTLGQLKADALVERTTGTPGGITGVEIQLVITDRTLLQSDSEPARLPGYGVVPTGWARDLLNTGGKPAGARQEPRPGGGTGKGFGGGGTTGTNTARNTDRDKAFNVWLRRLYTAPGSTTSSPGTTAAPPPTTTAPGSAKPATTPKKPPAGTSGPDQDQDTLSKSRPPQATATIPPHHHSRAGNPRWTFAPNRPGLLPRAPQASASLEDRQRCAPEQNTRSLNRWKHR